MLPEFGKRFPALSKTSLAVELSDRLAWELCLNNVKQNFKILGFGCLKSRSIQPDEDLLVGRVVWQGDEDFWPSRVRPFAKRVDDLPCLRGSGRAWSDELKSVAPCQRRLRQKLDFGFVDVGGGK